MFRSLTIGEIAGLRPIFGEELDYRAVRVHRGADFNPVAWLAFRLRNEAIALGQEIYVRPAHYRDDYAAGPRAGLAFLAHEATHVWQWRTGRFHPARYWREWLTLPARGYAIDHLPVDTPFQDMAYEQQAEVVRQCALGDERYVLTLAAAFGPRVRNSNAG